MLVTVFSDASWCPETHAGGWAGWAKSRRRKCEGEGQLRDLLPSSNAAEICAIGNAVHMSLLKGVALPGDELLIQSDCMHAINVLASQASHTITKLPCGYTFAASAPNTILSWDTATSLATREGSRRGCTSTTFATSGLKFICVNVAASS